MATDSSLLGYSTLDDIVNNYSSLDSRSMYIEAARVLARMCPLIGRLPFVESNQILSNIATRTDYIPTPSTRRFNEGVLATASKNVPLRDPIAMFEAYSEVDKAECDIQNDPVAWRRDQDMNHVEGFRQTVESAMWYDSLAEDPGLFNGLATRFNSLTNIPNGLADWQPNVWDGGAASGNSTSIWIMEMGLRKVYGIYPKNTPGGLQIRNLGEVTKEYTVTAGASVNKMYQVYRTHFQWWMGLQVNDERCVQRVANVNPDLLSTNNFDENTLIAAKNQLPDSGENPATIIFVNRDLKTQIDIRAVSQRLNTYFTQEASGDVFGRPVTRFQGIPILVAEKILSSETIVS